MESEKVKEIKKVFSTWKMTFHGITNADILILINELESENAELKKYRFDWLNGEKMHLQAEMEETEFELSSSNSLFEIVSKENKQLKDRIAEFESENERLQNKNHQLEQDLGQCENGYKLELHTARYQMQSANEDLEKAKNRIAELEFELSKKRLEINALKCGKEIAEGVIEVVEKEEIKLALKQFAERLKEKCNDKNTFICSNSITATEIDETLKEAIEDDK